MIRLVWNHNFEAFANLQPNLSQSNLISKTLEINLSLWRLWLIWTIVSDSDSEEVVGVKLSFPWNFLIEFKGGFTSVAI